MGGRKKSRRKGGMRGEGEEVREGREERRGGIGGEGEEGRERR